MTNNWMRVQRFARQRTLALVFATLLGPTALTGCGPEQQATGGQAHSGTVPVSLALSFPHDSATASTSGSWFWATVQSWLPTVTTAWAATTADLSTLSVEVTGPGLPSPITETKILSAPASKQLITFNLDVPVGPNRVFTVSGTDATRRKIFGGQCSPIVLTAGQAASVDITLTGAGVGEASPLTAARRNHTATLLPNGQVLVVGGSGANGVLASAELFDPVTNKWTPLAAGLTDARSSHTATLLQNGQVLIVGGHGTSSPLAAVELFDPAKNTWTRLPSLTDARDFHTATLLPSGQILVVGGFKDNDTLLASAELFDLS